jgi:uncharacterized small protein (DUF1192 family)
MKNSEWTSELHKRDISTIYQLITAIEDGLKMANIYKIKEEHSVIELEELIKIKKAEIQRMKILIKSGQQGLNKLKDYK